jgi:ribosomal protein S18 acetylase RimI-like enzyme
VRSSNLRDETTSEPPNLPFGGDDADPIIKFQPFVARNELRRRMLGYYRELPTPSGQILVVQPVSEEWIEPAADLLTEAFADSMGYVTIYKNFLRRQIRNYLRSHMNLPPKTVCLIALLVNKEVLEKLPQIDEDSGFYSELEVNDDGGGGSMVGDIGSSDSTSTSSAADVAGGVMGDGMGNNFWPSFSSSTTTTDPNSNEEVDSTSEHPPRLRLDASTATLVGAVEVSFTESTRTKEWTGLNPPPERPYLCNMAVAGEVRRQGIGVLMLKAAEDLVQKVGEDQMYLHLRFKDAPAAALYRKAGYAPAAQDSIFVKLVGQDRRWLMKKMLKEE